MATKVFVTFPVSDLMKSRDFYQALGFKQNMTYSDETTSSMVWDEHFTVMLTTKDFYQKFIPGRTLIDARKQNGALVAFLMNSADEVREFAKVAQENGGSFYHYESGIPETEMLGYEVEDLDGNILEPTWMKG
ncbi:VOC family protein [Enterococcus timonensis]|uniref:VOC family protein n=1 Tax=Enterococcus timonensis TaxID=1852364 RepID=UPI0008D9F97D|nr:VOC family protein [Enterococcus timonensis]